MHVKDRFKKYLQNPLSVEKNDRILLAVSGGRDSMLMAHLFSEAGYKCVILHCNFHLRGKESDLDEQLVTEFAAGKGIPCLVKHFDTQDYAASHNVSIQMAARELRYAWFEEQREELKLDWIAIAQHRNDHIETAFINLCRGTGIVGLQGILPQRGVVIRPLLFIGSAEITDEVQRLKIPFRDDQSNFSTKYLRNKIRLEILPKFQEITPEFDQIMVENMDRFRQSAQLLTSFIEPIKRKIFQFNGTMYLISKKELALYIDNGPLLYELFRDFDFSMEVLKDLQSNFHGIAGKVFQSPRFEVLLDRESLWLRSRGTDDEQLSIIVEEQTRELEFFDLHFSINRTEDLRILTDEYQCQVDFDLLIFPLQFRGWKQGDVFSPLGMNGKMKVSDFFTQQKIDLFQKKRVPILVNGNGEIIWIVKHRIDNRYRISKKTKKVYNIACN